jgi:hypothetical protein
VRESEKQIDDCRVLTVTLVPGAGSHPYEGLREEGGAGLVLRAAAELLLKERRGRRDGKRENENDVCV